MSGGTNRRCLRAHRTQPKFEVTGNKNHNIIKTSVNKNNGCIENEKMFKSDSCDGDKANKEVSIQDKIHTLDKKDSSITELKVLYIPSTYKFNWNLSGRENVSPKIVKDSMASRENKLKIYNANVQKEIWVEKLTELGNNEEQSSSQDNVRKFNDEKLDVTESEENTRKEPSSSQEDESNLKEVKLDIRESEDNTEGQSSSQKNESTLKEEIWDIRVSEENTKGQSSNQKIESNLKEDKLDIRGSEDNTEGQSSCQKNESTLKDEKWDIRVSEENTNGQSSNHKIETNVTKDKLDIRGSEENTENQISSQKNESTLKDEKLDLRASEENTKGQSRNQKIESNLKEDKLDIRGSEENTEGQISSHKIESNLKEDTLDIIGSEDDNKMNLNEENLSASTFEDREETRKIEGQSDVTKNSHYWTIKNEESHSRSSLVQCRAPILKGRQKEHIISSISEKIIASTSQNTHITNPPSETISRKCLRALRKKPQSEYKTALTINSKEESRESTINSESSKAGYLENTISSKIRNSSVVSGYENSQIDEPPVINEQIENCNYSLCENDLKQIIERTSSVEQNNKELNLKTNYDEFKEVEQEVPISNWTNKERSDTISGTNSVVTSNNCDINTVGINKEYQNKYENKKTLQVVPSIEKEIKQSGNQSTPKAIAPPLLIPPAQNESSMPRRCLRARRRQHAAIEKQITMGNKEINQEEVKGNNYKSSIAESGPTSSTSKNNTYTSLPKKKADRDTNNHNENSSVIINKNSKSVTLSCDSILTHSNTENCNKIVNPDTRKSEKTKNRSLIKGNKESERSNSQTAKNNEEMGATAVRNEELESVCSICLEPCSGRAFTNPCLHEFCYTCILQWSEVKPECPLCKRLFSSILHNIKGDENYDEQLIPQASTTAEYETNPRVADEPSVVPQSSSENYLQRFVSNYRLAFHYCPICYRACSSADVLALHLQSDHNDRHTASSEPRAISTSRTPYVQHNAYESTSRIPYAQQNAYECKICGRVCASGAGLASHLRAHARNDSPSTSSGSYYGRKSTYEYARGISNEPVWASAPSTSRTPSRASSYGQSSGYACSVCGRACASGAGLASHMRAHSRRGEY